MGVGKLPLVSPTGLSSPQSTITHRVYLDVQINNQPPQRIILGLYGDSCPKTVQNYLALCTTGVDVPSTVDSPLNTSQGSTRSYKNTPLHRIIPSFMLQGGDITSGNGFGGYSVHGSKFDDENFDFYHHGGGVLSMANAGKNTNSSQFFVTFGTQSGLDGKHTVFGVVDGEESWEVCRFIERYGSGSGNVKGKIVIKDCGVLEG
ncbi:hypothetical protein TrVE_jg9155 [Triparma verrucosa]|uniref:Peptidyl-prolyl cis-trans isomerase n=1 Tax=Triparma verrucosa TaxID=1606542 RepID=A0A9W7BRW5_9STRA|nr:hypothetical protein TrVE_jg9155 [Triparma verrucosa]